MKRLLIIGSTCVDVILRLDHLPTTGEDMHPVQRFAMGGCAFNVAQVPKAYDVDLRFVTPIGDHGVFSDFVRAHLDNAGFRGPITVPDSENGCCYCLVERSGERTFLSVHGIEYSFHAEYMDAFAGERFDYTYICGLEVEETTGGELVAWLEAHPDIAGTVVYAPGPRGIEVDTDRTERILGMHPILHLNEQEAQALAGMSGSEDRVLAAAQVLHAKTGNMVIVTRGADGVLWISADGSVHSAPSVPSTVVDTIGAGDSHCGAVLTGLTLGWTEEDTMRFANQIASEVVAQEGGAYIRR
ncbi:carbohydrate kinase family protein [Oribacterium sp. P9]|uniref:carbohydrate kinase family protein n=1 Tax=unclassified Oribacterium TaxID=2629782 RepID=UPI0039676D23